MIARRSSSVLGFVLLCAVSTACSSGGGDEASGMKPSGSSGSTGKAGATGSAGSISTSGSSSNPTAGSSTGGTESSGGGAANVPGAEACSPIPDDCTASAGVGLLPFADFSSDTGFYLFTNVDDKMGMTVPAGGVNLTPEEIVCPAGGLCGGAISYAMHVSGGGFTTYGPSLSRDNVYPSAAMPGTFEGMPQDVSTYTGVQFWARKGTAASNPQIGITLNDDTSAPGAGLCDEKAVAGVPMSKACFDGFWGKISATSAWKLYKIPFASLKQQGFGNKAADAKFHPDKLYGVSFNLPMQTFDLWIGNISFYQ